MRVLENLEPKKVFEYFEDITRIPHGSGNVEVISNYIADFAKSRDLKYRQDDMHNIIVWKEASKGYENSKPVIIQGHMDMVAVKTADSNKDMEKEGLDLEIEGDWITADKTSLGGDDGIAVAYALAILDSSEIAHPPIEAVFTVDEEVGMLGAAAIDVSDLKGKLLLNVDSEDEGIFTVSCAGGATATCILPYNKDMINAKIIEMRLDGFTGGHSGAEIHKERANSNCVLGRILLNVFENIDMRIIGVNGGEKDNAIANLSEAAIAVLPECVDRAKEIINKVFDEVKDEYKVTDPAMKITLNVMDSQLVEAMSGPSTLATVILLANLPNGVERMNPEIKDMVQTSLNLGILRTTDKEVRMSYSVRSSKDSEKNYLIQKLKSLTEIFGGSLQCEGVYPGWEYRADSVLRDTAVKAYREVYGGKEPVVEGIHAGLECGLFASKIDDLDAISFGPDMKDIHTTDEKLSISSTKRTWELLVKILEMLK